jgi:hypothetical protein
MPHPGLHQLASKHLVALDRSLLDGMAADLPARRCVHAAKMLGEKLLSAWAIQRRKVLVPKLVQIGERILGTVDGIGAFKVLNWVIMSESWGCADRTCWRATVSSCWACSASISDAN